MSSFRSKRVGPVVWIAVLLILPSALAYLSLANRLGFYNDDWFLIYPIKVQGLNVLHTIFAGDRPARAFLVSAFYSLFGLHAPWYSYSAYLFRLSAGLAFYWALIQVWPGKRVPAGAAALLFVIYPGFLDQPNAFDFQTHLVSLAMAMTSIALSIKVLRSPGKTGLQMILTALAGLLTFTYLALMEYYIGLEGLRFLLIGYWVLREKSRREKLAGGLRNLTGFVRSLTIAWAPSLMTLLVFMVWRTLIFHNLRGDTDINGMISGLGNSPLRGVWALVYILQDLFNVIIFAWATPASIVAFGLRLRDFLFAAGAAVLGAGITAGMIAMGGNNQFTDSAENTEPQKWQEWQVAWIGIGIAAVVISLIPIALGNRHVIYTVFNRFSLPGSAGAVMVAAGLLFMPRRRLIATLGMGVLVWIAILTHYANSAIYAADWEATRQFWWQVSWRAPGLKPGTTLMMTYPGRWLSQDYMIWGPANWIYYPDQLPLSDHPLPLSAAAFYPDTLQRILTAGGKDTRDRGMETVQDFNHGLLLWQPDGGSCLRIMDSTNPDYPAEIDERMLLIAPYSHIEQVDMSAPPTQPPAGVFGAEPKHTWCYFYQKAALARQRGDWQTVAQLGSEATQAGLRPDDRAEYLPFLQAYANLGDFDQARQIVPIINDIPLLKLQACKQFSSSNHLNAEARAFLTKAFCATVP